MPIFDTDLKIRKSERMTDFDDGGGFITGNEVVDGVSNNAFPDVSSLDYTYGRVALRKVFPSVESPDTDTYFGAHCIISDAPDNLNISATMFTTDDWDDERVQAENYIESFKSPVGNTTIILNGDHSAGSFGLSLVVNPSDAQKPAVGDILQLIYHEGLVDEVKQFIKIASSSFVVQTFNNAACGNFDREVYTIVMEDPLEFLFPGDTPHCNVATFTDTKVRFTTNNTSSRYYSITDLASPATMGQTSITVASTKSQLVPVGITYTPLLNQQPTPINSFLFQTHTGTVSVTINAATTDTVFYMGGPVTPGTWVTSIAGGFTDDSIGNIKNNAMVIVGTIDYHTGRCAFAPVFGGAAVFTFTPAGSVSRPRESHSIEITSGNQASFYSIALSGKTTLPLALASVLITYISAGNLYSITSTLGGSLTGNGSGTVNVTTGVINATLTNLPDIGTPVMVYWNSGMDVQRSADLGPISKPRLYKTAAGQIVPGSILSGYTSHSPGPNKVFSDDGVGGITGDATGTVDYLTGEMVIEPNFFIGTNLSITSISINLSAYTRQTDAITIAGPNGAFSGTLTNLPVQTGSVRVTATAQGRQIKLKDDGAGNIQRVSDSVTVGTINYTSGAISATLSESFPRYDPLYSTYTFTTWTGSRVRGYSPSSITHYATGIAVVNYRLSGAVSAATVENLSTSAGYTIDIHSHVPWTVEPKSIRFVANGLTYTDEGGVIYESKPGTTNVGINRGPVNYTTRKISLVAPLFTSPPVAAIPSTITFQGAAVSVHTPVQTGATFRSVTAPIGNTGFTTKVTDLAGANRVQTGSLAGVINGDQFFGTVDYTTGVCRVSFGAYEVYTGAQNSEPWFDAALIVGGNILRPSVSQYKTFLYDMLQQVITPLDPNLIQLDTSLLPPDGKVSVILPSDVVVIHQTLQQVLPNPLLPSTSHNTGYTRLAVATVKDTNGLVLPPTNNYTVNLDTGIYSFLSTLSTAGFVQPFYAHFRIEDMAVALSVTSAGVVTLNKQLSRNYPATLTKVSGALIFGDLQARYTNLFDQATWTGVFSDTLIGSAATWNYNDLTYPIVVTNKGCIQERWALVFTNSTTFNIIGETVGQVGTGNVTTNASPNNPNTGVPYFFLDALGWGSGQATGNVLRFNTVGANHPLWLARSVLPSTPTTGTDSFTLQFRGDVNA